MKRLLTYREQIILRETETWNRQQARLRRLLIILFAIATIAVMAIAGCNGSHGRC
jgi:hypothetical protein